MAITRKALGEAARQNDQHAVSIGKKVVPKMAEEFGIEIRDLLHIAEQRGLRMILANRGVEMIPFMRIELNPQEEKLLDRLRLAWLDGVFIALRVKDNQRSDGQKKIELSRPGPDAIAHLNEMLKSADLTLAIVASDVGIPEERLVEAIARMETTEDYQLHTVVMEYAELRYKMKNIFNKAPNV